MGPAGAALLVLGMGAGAEALLIIACLVGMIGLGGVVDYFMPSAQLERERRQQARQALYED